MVGDLLVELHWFYTTVKSGGCNCPSLYRATGGGCIAIQGWLPPEMTTVPFFLRQEQRLEILVPQDVADKAVAVAADIIEATFQRNAHEEISDLRFDATTGLVRVTGLPISREAQLSLINLAYNEDALVLSVPDLRSFTAWWRFERRSRDRSAKA
jgi:hypothetical protein